MKKNLVFSIINVFLTTIFPIVIFPYVARVLGANGIGTYNYYNLGISYIALIASFGINIYGVREIGKFKDNLEKRSKTAIELIFLNIISASVFFLIIICCAAFTKFNSDFTIIILLGCTLLTNAITVEWFFVGIEFQKFILIRSFIIKVLSLFLILIFVDDSSDLMNYILIIVVGLAINAIINFIFFIKLILPFNFNLSALEFKSHLGPLSSIFLVEIAIRYFGMADVVILGSSADREIVGHYSLALNIFLIITSFIRISAITLLPKSAYFLKENQMEEFNNLIKSTIKFILFIGVPSTIGVYFWSDLIVSVLGGDDFKYSSSILKIFSLSIIIVSIVNMIVFQILYPQNRIRVIFFCFLAGIGVNLILNWTLISVLSAQGVVISAILSQIIIFILLLITNKSYISFTIISKDMLKYIYAGILLLITSYLIRLFLHNHYLILQFIISVTVYISTLFILKESVFITYGLNLLKNEKSR